MTTSTAHSSPDFRLKSLNHVWEMIDSPGDSPRGSKKRHSARQAFEGTFNSELALQIIKRGISSRVIDPLSIYLEVGKGELAGILDLDRSTALRRADKDLPLPRHSAESVLRLLELKAMACDAFESENDAIGWLRRPHPLLDGESPLESASTSFGSRRVKDILVAIKYGGAV